MNARKCRPVAVLLLALGAVLSLWGCSGRPPAVENAAGSGSAAIRQQSAGGAGLPGRLEGFTASQHFEQRMRERGVSEAQVTDVLKNGQRFYDPKNDSYIRWKDGVYVALTGSGVIKTVIRGPVVRRWRPQ